MDKSRWPVSCGGEGHTHRRDSDAFLVCTTQWMGAGWEDEESGLTDGKSGVSAGHQKVRWTLKGNWPSECCTRASNYLKISNLFDVEN